MSKKIRTAYKVFQKKGVRGTAAALWDHLTLDDAKIERAFVLDPLFDVSEEDFEANTHLLSAFESGTQSTIQSITWFIPYTDAHAMGGRTTIYRFASFLETQKKVRNRYAILARTSIPLSSAVEMLRAHVPTASVDNVSVVASLADVRSLPPTDAGIATKWNTAYALLRFNQTKAKFYFVQDFEAMFHPAGIAYAAAEATYRFGFWGIVSTPGLEEEYAAYARHHTSFTPAVDTVLYHPGPAKRTADPLTIFFYGRPSASRNGFVLGIEALKKVKRRYADRVRILTAGEEWEPKKFGVDGIIENRGLLKSVEEVASLYREVDVGLGLIFTKHTSYQPFEYMASGVAVITNRNRFGEWFLKDGENCLLAEPSASDIAAKISRLVEDSGLRKKLVVAGMRAIAATSWDAQFDRVWQYMNKLS